MACTGATAIITNADGYTQSVGWNAGHRLSDLIRTDAIEMFMECDTMGDDGAAVSSSTGSDIPVSGIILTSHSSLEYNLENSSWIINQASPNPYAWTSLDVNGDNTISIVDDPDDITSITGMHEDYPFFLSTGASPTDLYEWAISYEMALDVSHCTPSEAVIGVASIHNSPEKGADADGDGVADSADLCPGTMLPELIPTVELRGKRYADMSGDGVFESGNSRTDQAYSVIDTGGCSAEQIIAQMQLGRGHIKYGLADSVLKAWIASVNGE
jgi:hypothetical protein